MESETQEPQELSARILRSLLLYIKEEHGRAGLDAVFTRAQVAPELLDGNTSWISHETFERVIEACREEVGSTRAFRQACIHDMHRGYGVMLLAFSLLNGRQAYEALAATMPMVSKISRYEVEARSQSELEVRYFTERAESRLMCLTRRAQLPTCATFVGLPMADLEETSCVAWGDECCTYEVRLQSYSRWRRPALGTAAGVVLGATMAAVLDLGFFYLAGPLGGLGIGAALELLRRSRAQRKLVDQAQLDLQREPTLSLASVDAVPAASLPKTSRVDREAPTQTTPKTPDSGRLESATDSPRIGPGDKVGRYEVVEVAGRGGMGTVFSARDTKLGRRVALKLLHARRQSDQIVARLVREAQALATLSHPNVVTVFDVGEWGNAVFLAMEYVEGQTLKSWKSSHPEATQRRRLGLLLQAADGLAAAHAAGPIHRDFKPSNVLVGDDGRVRVVDFGLARRTEQQNLTGLLPVRRTTAESEAADSQESSPSYVTRTGQVAGTPQYMAPEQHEGRRLDPRCDQFSFCVVAYTLLAGVPPFTRDEDGYIYAAAKARSFETPTRRVDKNILAALVQGLDPNRQRRHPSMRALANALRDALVSDDVGRSSQGRSLRQRLGLRRAKPVGDSPDP